MKNTKSKTPVDVLRALEAARRAVNEAAAALALIDPAAFATCTRYNDAWEDLRSLQGHVAALDADRPLTKTERARLAAAEAEASSESTPPGVVEAQLEAA